MRRRLLLSYLSLAALVLLCLEIPLGFVYSRGERERVVTAAKEEADSVSAYASLSISAGRAERELRPRVLMCAERIGGKVLVVDGLGRPLATSHDLSAQEARELASRPEIAAALGGRSTADVRTSTIGGVRSLSVAAPVTHGAELQGAVRIIVPTEAVSARIHRIWLLLALAGLAVLTALAAVAFGLARWISRPILQVERAARRLAEGSLATPVPTTEGPPEIRSLAATFNQTAARLEHLLASQRAFAGEASHQLKTPLAALRLRLDNLEPDIAGHARGSLTAAMTETDRLARMVEGLLAMARMEESAGTREPVGLDRVCAERTRAWAPLFEQHGVRLVRHGEFAGQVFAVPGAIEQIVDNLLSNALRASPVAGTVVLEIRAAPADRRHHRAPRPTWVELHVVDQGPGMTAEQRHRAFDRFWRAPDAPKGGTGLGLSLVQRLTHASGGDAALRPAPDGGLDAVVRLQAATPPRPSATRPARPAHRGSPEPAHS
ncbi:HAMP domain-containing sensor histidine kinase [Streptomyces sp. NPDC005970]|uniref:sensor histidine kinase n=1 Tax=Streptomyces sp. NPDC005970 TaxID=3156723 RepID=UPI0033CE230D